MLQRVVKGGSLHDLNRFGQSTKENLQPLASQLMIVGDKYLHGSVVYAGPYTESVRLQRLNSRNEDTAELKPVWQAP